MTEKLYTASNRFTKPVAGASRSVWAFTGINTNLDLLDEAFDGQAHVTVAAPETRLAVRQGLPDQARCRILILEGSPDAPALVVVPPVAKWYFAVNACSNSQPVTLGTGVGKAVSVPRNTTVQFLCDGVDCTLLFANQAKPMSFQAKSTDYQLSASDMGTVYVSVPSDGRLPLLSSLVQGWWVDIHNATSQVVHVRATPPDACPEYYTDDYLLLDDGNQMLADDFSPLTTGGVAVDDVAFPLSPGRSAHFLKSSGGWVAFYSTGAV